MIEINLVQFWIGIIVLLCGGLGSAFAVGWNLSQKINAIRVEWQTDLKTKVKERDDKIQRVYERLDQHKRDVESKMDARFVCTQVCDAKHSETARNVEKLERRMEAFEKEMRGYVIEIKEAIGKK